MRREDPAGRRRRDIAEAARQVLWLAVGLTSLGAVMVAAGMTNTHEELSNEPGVEAPPRTVGSVWGNAMERNSRCPEAARE